MTRHDLGVPATEVLRIGELAALSGVPTKTIRFYEQEGLLPPAARAPNGYRSYGPEAVERLRFVRGARLLGLSLGEIQAVLALQEQGVAPCQEVVTLLERHEADIQQRIQELQSLQDALRRLRERAATLPENVQMEGCVCHLIRQQSGEVPTP